MSNVRVLQGDCRVMLSYLAEEDLRFHTCVTSPPYWGLRDYGHADQLGMEATPEEYVANLVNVFRFVRRVLRDDGTLWLNLGDSYAGSGRGIGDTKTTNKGNGASRDMHDAMVESGAIGRSWVAPPPGLKRKDLVGIPWRVALALQADGWYLRSDIIWSKPNPMPESVTDRPTKSHEYIFLLSKSEDYFYDWRAVMEPSGGWNGSRFDDGKNAGEGEQRNKRDVWNVPVKPFRGAHFATFPPELIEPCILAGCPRIICEECNAPIHEMQVPTDRTRVFCEHATYGMGWKPGIVLDPFGGSGTTGEVASKHGRDAVLIELNPEYAAMAERRIANAPMSLFTNGAA